MKRVPNFATVLTNTMIEATSTQLRVMAEESRELLIDKVMAGPVARGAAVMVPRPARLRYPKLLIGTDRRPFRHVALRPRTIARKIRRGTDGRKLVETGDYIRGIEVFRGTQRSGVYYLVRMKPKRHRGADPNSGKITLKELARVHEYGSARHNIPARMHWAPVIRSVRHAFAQLPDNVRAPALREALRQVR